MRKKIEIHKIKSYTYGFSFSKLLVQVYYVFRSVYFTFYEKRGNSLIISKYTYFDYINKVNNFTLKHSIENLFFLNLMTDTL